MKITKKKIINISLIMLMVISFSIFAVYEIKNKGKVEKAQLQQESTVPQEVLDAQGDDEKELDSILKYYNDNLKKELFEKFLVKNIGENIRYSDVSKSSGEYTVNDKGEKIYDNPSYKYYPLIRVDKVDFMDEFKGETIEDEEMTCIRLSVTVTNDSDKDAIYVIYYMPVGIIKDNYTYSEQSTEKNHYRDFKDKDEYIFYKAYYDENNNLIGAFPYEETPDEVPGPKFLLAANSSKTYYEYYKIPKEWIDTGKLAYGDDGLTRERMNGSVDYCTRSFRIMLFPDAE